MTSSSSARLGDVGAQGRPAELRSSPPGRATGPGPTEYGACGDSPPHPPLAAAPPAAERRHPRDHRRRSARASSGSAGRRPPGAPRRADRSRPSPPPRRPWAPSRPASWCRPRSGAQGALARRQGVVVRRHPPPQGKNPASQAPKGRGPHDPADELHSRWQCASTKPGARSPSPRSSTGPARGGRHVGRRTHLGDAPVPHAHRAARDRRPLRRAAPSRPADAVASAAQPLLSSSGFGPLVDSPSGVGGAGDPLLELPGARAQATADLRAAASRRRASSMIRGR